MGRTPDSSLKRVRDWSRRNRTRNKLALKDGHLQRAYGLTLEEYNEMWEGQGGVCAICKGTNKSGIALSVDHDHKTGEVRELLCGNCNGKLGWFEMYSPEVLNYLARNNKPQQKLSLVVVDPELWEDGKEKFEELIEKGHTVRFLDFSGFDGVLGEQASRFNKHLLPRLPVLISEIRKRRKAKNANPRHG